MANAQHSAKTVQHFTPPLIIAMVKEVLGTIHLDPASSEEANKIVGATEYFSARGLEHPWTGNVFLNPPGRDKLTNPNGAAAWWEKLMTEWSADGGSWDAIYLGFSLEQLQTCQAYPCPHPTQFPTCFPRKRIRFCDADGIPQDRPTHGNFITCVTTKMRVRTKFIETFSMLGHVLA